MRSEVASGVCPFQCALNHYALTPKELSDQSESPWFLKWFCPVKNAVADGLV
jgi:hypothetical protein